MENDDFKSAWEKEVLEKMKLANARQTKLNEVFEICIEQKKEDSGFKRNARSIFAAIAVAVGVVIGGIVAYKELFSDDTASYALVVLVLGIFGIAAAWEATRVPVCLRLLMILGPGGDDRTESDPTRPGSGK